MSIRLKAVSYKFLFTKLVLLGSLLLVANAANATVLATKEAFSTDGAPIVDVELGQTIEYAFNWSCSFTGTPPPGECGDFVLTDPLPAGVDFVSCSVPGIYSCAYDPGTRTVTIEAIDPLELFLNGQSATASIFVDIATDQTLLTGGTTDPLVNTAQTDSADGLEDVVSSLNVNEPTNNWEVSKVVSAPSAPLEPALDNNVAYQIQACPNGPAGLGTGTIIINNPTIIDACPAGAVVVGARLNGIAVTPVGACPSLGIPLPTTFDPADGCQTIDLTLQYPSSDFNLGDIVVNTATLDGDEIFNDCPGGCIADATSTLSVPNPGAGISKVARRQQIAANAFNRYTINFDTLNSNVEQNNVTIQDTFPVQIDAVGLSHNGAWSDANVTAEITELGTGAIIQSGYNGGGISHNFTAGATGFLVTFNTPVPPSFMGGSYEITFRPDSGLANGVTFQNCVSVSTDELASDPMSCADVEIISPTADLNVTKNMPAGVAPGVPFTTTFQLIQENTSSTGAVNPIITDCLPNDLEFVSWDSISYSGVDDPLSPNTSNTLPIGVAPNFEVLEVGDSGYSCADTTRRQLRWSWQATAPAGSVQLDGTPGVNNPFTLPVRRDNNGDDIEDVTGALGLTVNIGLSVTLQVRPGEPATTGLSNEVVAEPENADFRCLNNILGIGVACNRVENYDILSSAAFGGSKFVAGFPGLPNFDPDNPPADNSAAASAGIVTPASCPVDADGRTRTPCVAQAMQDQPFNYRIRLSNDGNVQITDYVAYDILPHTDIAGSDTGITEAQTNTVRGSTWVPLLNGPIVVSSDDPGVAAELAANLVIEYSASTNPCRPELSIANDTLGGDWQSGNCDDDWTSTPLADGITFPDGYASVKAWRIYVPFASGWRTGNPLNQEEEDIIVDMVMLADPNAAPSDYESVPPNVEIAWNNVAFRATNVDNGRRLLASEAIRTGIVMPPEFPLQSTGLRIGNLVWQDVNNNGIAEDGEPGIFDVTVQLWSDTDGSGGPSAGDTLFDTTQTGAAGVYLFDDADTSNRDNLGIPAGDYYVVIPDAQTGSFVLADNYSSTTNASGTDDDIDNDDNGVFNTSGTPIGPIDGIYSEVISLTLGGESAAEELRNGNGIDDDDDFFTDEDSNVSVDFGFYQLRLGNHVWLDLDNDGIADSNETAIEGLLLELFIDDGDGLFDPDVDTLLTTDATDANGQYLFDALDIENYFIAIPEGQTGLTSDGTTYSTNGVNAIRSSGPTSAASIANDNDDDGAPGVFGSVTPTAYASVSRLLNLTTGGALLAEADTSSDGIIGTSSTDVLDANVELTENLKINSAFADANSYLSVDFGFVPDVSLGSTIWVDTNGNGLQDEGEVGIPGALVTLLDSGGNPLDGDPFTIGVQNIEATTDASGQYFFNDLAPGTYRISVDLSGSSISDIDDFVPSPAQVPNPNDDGPLDSNIDFAFDTLPSDLIHFSGPITLLAGTEPSGETDPIDDAGAGVLADSDQPGQAGLLDNAGNMTLDLGFVPPVSLGSTLWVDDNENGLQDLLEPAIVNARVTLLNSDGTEFDSDPYTTGDQVLFVDTDANGQYNFDGLPAGNYRVRIELSGASNANAAVLVPTPSQVADPNAILPAIDDNTDSNIDSAFDTNLNDQIHFSGIISLVPGTEPINEVDPIDTSGTSQPDQPNQGLTASDDPDANGNMTLDFGFIEPVSLGSTVWFDSNFDGLQTTGEPPIVGARVTLLNGDGSPYDSNPATPAIDGLTIDTNSNGEYNFNGLPEGDYLVSVDLNFSTSHTGATLFPTPIQTPDPDAAGPNQDSNVDSNVDTRMEFIKVVL